MDIPWNIENVAPTAGTVRNMWDQALHAAALLNQTPTVVR